MATVLLGVLAYLCGSLPTGVWFGRWAGVDVRRSGSGNIGATNVARTAGVRLALLTLICDIAKGFVPTVIARALLVDPWLVQFVGLAAFFGHIYSVFLRFSVGKGVATGFGVFLGLAPIAAVVCVAVFAAVAFSTRYVSLASMAAAASLPVASVLAGYGIPTCASGLVIGAVIVARHRDNLGRLRRGVEPKFRASH